MPRSVAPVPGRREKDQPCLLPSAASHRLSGRARRDFIHGGESSASDTRPPAGPAQGHSEDAACSATSARSILHLQRRWRRADPKRSEEGSSSPGLSGSRQIAAPPQRPWRGWHRRGGQSRRCAANSFANPGEDGYPGRTQPMVCSTQERSASRPATAAQCGAWAGAPDAVADRCRQVSPVQGWIRTVWRSLRREVMPRAPLTSALKRTGKSPFRSVGVYRAVPPGHIWLESGLPQLTAVKQQRA